MMEKQNPIDFIKARLESAVDLYGWDELSSPRCQAFIEILNECMDNDKRHEFYRHLSVTYKK